MIPLKMALLLKGRVGDSISTVFNTKKLGLDLVQTLSKNTLFR